MITISKFCKIQMVPAMVILDMPALHKIDLGTLNMEKIRMIKYGERDEMLRDVGGYYVIDDVFKMVGGRGHQWNGAGNSIVKYVNLEEYKHVAVVDPWLMHVLFRLNGDASLLDMTNKEVKYFLFNLSYIDIYCHL